MPSPRPRQPSLPRASSPDVLVAVKVVQRLARAVNLIGQVQEMTGRVHRLIVPS